MSSKHKPKLQLGALGQKVSVPTSYSSSILERVARLDRSLGITVGERTYPRLGCDMWQAYEVCCLYGDSIPAVGLLKLAYDASSEYIVESKSLKLYLNSLNSFLVHDARSPAVALEAMRCLIVEDLSALLGTAIHAAAHTERGALSDFAEYVLLDTDPHFIQGGQFVKGAVVGGHIAADGVQERRAATHLLRTNCPVTGQPDWGSVFVVLHGGKPFVAYDFLQYILNLRDDQHFHEEVCDGLFAWLLRRYQPEEAMVSCIYTRRGGIDISPIRATSAALMPTFLSDVSQWTCGTARQ